MRVLKWSIGLILLVFLGIASFYGVLLFVNQKDESLSAEAKAFAAGAALVVPVEKNGYFAALGWRTATKNDPYVAGRWIFEGRRAAIEENKAIHLLPDVLGIPNRIDLCEQRRAGCLEMVSQKRVIVQKLLIEHATLLARIRDLENYPSFSTPPLKVKTPWQSVGVLDYVMFWRLGATASAYAWLTGNFEEAIAATAIRIAVARRMVRDSGGALDTAMGVAWLRSEYLLISEILHRDPDMARVHMSALDALLTPLSAEEIQAVRWIHGEFSALVEQYAIATRDDDAWHLLLNPLFFDQGIENLTDREQFRANLPTWYIFLSNRLRPLYQPNATVNLHYRIFSGFEGVIRATPKVIGKLALNKNRSLNKKDRGLSLFNPIGRAIDVFEPYEILFRLHDIDRFIRLVAVQAALTKENVAPRDVGMAIESYPGAIDPATGQRMRWDAARSRITIPAMAELWTRHSGSFGERVGEISVTY